MFASPRSGPSVVGQTVIAVMLTLLLATAIAAQSGDGEPNSEPWWTQQKIRYFWGQWLRYEETNISTEEVMKNLDQVGATVFVERGAWGVGLRTWHDGFDHEQARLAHKYGMRYFGTLYVANLVRFVEDMNGPVRLSVDTHGNPYDGMGPHSTGHDNIKLPCPLYRPVYEEWFLKPTLEAARTGLVDGLHLDWEYYNGRGEATVCFCDDCFGTFVKAKGLDIDQPVPKDQRYAWLKDQGLMGEYAATFRRRRTEMFREFAQRIRQVKPDFIFAGYDLARWYPEIAEGLHSPGAPFFVIDSRHYSEDHTRPWWESTQTHYKNKGYLRIPGSWSNSLFGGFPEANASAAQWMYDAAINSDGYWVWFREELTPDMWRSFWIANRRIQATEEKVGDFLLHGQVDSRFVTVVEWTGDPSLSNKIVQRTYHLGDRHLLHVNNVHTDWPVRLRLRFPRLRADSHWLVTDPIAEATYVPRRDQAVWTGQQLRDGIVVSLPKRSELFLQLRPTSPDEAVAEGRVLLSDEDRIMPEHPVGETPAPGPGHRTTEELLAVTVTGSLGYVHAWAIGNAIHTIGSDGGNDKRLRQVRGGYLWSPVWSPDGSRIAFVHYTNGRGQIYAVDANSSRWANLSTNSYCDRSPAWSPDGNKIAFDIRDEC